MTAKELCEKHKRYHSNPAELVRDIKKGGEEDAKRFGYTPTPWTPQMEAQTRCCSDTCDFETCNNHTGHEYTKLQVNTLSCRFCSQKKYISKAKQPVLVFLQWTLFVPHILFHIVFEGILAPVYEKCPKKLRFLFLPFFPIAFVCHKIFQPIYDCGR